MASLARRRHLEAVAAVHAATAAEQLPAPARRNGEAVSEYELQRARLGVDLRRLKKIQSIERKIEAKREMIAAYDPWVEGVIGSGKAVQDEIVAIMMVWAIDLEDYERAWPLVEYVVGNKLALPDRYVRTAPTLVAEESADVALKHLGQERAADLDWLRFVDEVTAGSDMHDQVRAKLKAAIGREYLRRADATDPDSDGPAGAKRAGLERAIEQLRRALELNDRVGVKKDVERAERELKKLLQGE